MDRYGTPHDGIVNMLEALSDFIDDEAHGRGGYEVYFKIMQDELDSLRSGYLPNDEVWHRLPGAPLRNRAKVVVTRIISTRGG